MLLGRKLLTASVVLALAAATQTTRASYLATDPNSIPLYTGHELFEQTGTTGTLDVTVDYAVFAPNTPASETGLTSATGNYVYEYVASNVGPATDLTVSAVSVGLATGSGAQNAGNETTLLAGNVPDIQVIINNSFISNFYSQGVAPGENSDVLSFTSPDAPTFASSTIANGGVDVLGLLPSPAVPEPATFSLLLAGASVSLLSRRRKSACR